MLGLKYGSSEKSDYEYKGTPILRIPNIGDGIVDFSGGTQIFISPKGFPTEPTLLHSSTLTLHTTGVPKTAMLPNRAVNECSYSIRTLIGDKVLKGESMLMVLPMFHIVFNIWLFSNHPNIVT